MAVCEASPKVSYGNGPMFNISNYKKRSSKDTNQDKERLKSRSERISGQIGSSESFTPVGAYGCTLVSPRM